MNHTPTIFEKITPEIQQSLKAYCMKLHRNNATDAEDLYQDVIFRALKNEDKYVEKGQLKTWLYTIAHNSFVNNYRKWQKRKIYSEIYGAIPENTCHNEGEFIFDTQLIKGVLRKLRPRLREPLSLFIDGFQYEEIADMLAVPLGTIKSRIFLARGEMKKKLGIQDGYGGQREERKSVKTV